MMKKLMLMAAMMTVAIAVNAQNKVGQFTWAPTLGASLSTLTDTDDSKMRIGVAAAFDFEYGVTKNFGVSLALLTTNVGAKFDDATVKLSYLNFPLLANYYVAKGFALKAGIQPGYLGEAKLGGQKIDAKKFDLSIPLGLSFDIGQDWFVDARYNLGLTKVFDNSNSRNSSFVLSIGFKIPFNKRK